jgi:hypothetical protein
VGRPSFSPKEFLAGHMHLDERENFFEIGSVHYSGREKLFILSFLKFIIMNPERLSPPFSPPQRRGKMGGVPCSFLFL